MKILKKKNKLFLLLAFLVFAGSFFEFSGNTNVLPISTLVPSPTNTPTPTILPTPTPVPLVGYCLNVPVLFYHHVQPQSMAIEKKQTSMSVDNGVFNNQMEYLKSRGYNTITVKQLVDALITHASLGPKSIAITLDDGYKDVYDYAYPIFKKYNLTANLMIATGLLEGSIICLGIICAKCTIAV